MGAKLCTATGSANSCMNEAPNTFCCPKNDTCLVYRRNNNPPYNYIYKWYMNSNSNVCAYTSKDTCIGQSSLSKVKCKQGLGDCTNDSCIHCLVKSKSIWDTNYNRCLPKNTYTPFMYAGSTTTGN